MPKHPGACAAIIPIANREQSRWEPTLGVVKGSGPDVAEVKGTPANVAAGDLRCKSSPPVTHLPEWGRIRHPAKKNPSSEPSSKPLNQARGLNLPDFRRKGIKNNDAGFTSVNIEMRNGKSQSCAVKEPHPGVWSQVLHQNSASTPSLASIFA